MEPLQQSQPESAFHRDMKRLSILLRVLQGDEYDPDSKIEFLTDTQNLLERTRLETDGDIALQVFLRLCEISDPYIFESWGLAADLLAQAKISKGGLSRLEFVEIKKSANRSEQVIQVGTPLQPQTQQKKGWSLFRRKEQQQELTQ